MTTRRFFQTDADHNALVVQILRPVGSLADDLVMSELDQVLADLQATDSQDVIVDFCETEYFGSSMLEALRLIWNRVHEHQGKMVLCRVSPIGREILEVARFHELWPIAHDRAAAQLLLQSM